MRGHVLRLIGRSGGNKLIRINLTVNGALQQWSPEASRWPGPQLRGTHVPMLASHSGGNGALWLFLA